MDLAKYQVQKGDTLYTIAKRYGMTVTDLLKANPHLAQNPNRIFAGENIGIPTESATNTEQVKELTKNKEPFWMRVAKRLNTAPSNGEAGLSTTNTVAQESWGHHVIPEKEKWEFTYTNRFAPTQKELSELDTLIAADEENLFNEERSKIRKENNLAKIEPPKASSLSYNGLKIIK